MRTWQRWRPLWLVLAACAVVAVAVVVAVGAARGAVHRPRVAMLASPAVGIPAGFSVPQFSSAVGQGDTRSAVEGYLADIVEGNWAAAEGTLCGPLRAAYPTGAAFERAIALEVGSPLKDFVVQTADTHGHATYRLAGAAWGGGPYRVQLVGEGGQWKVCGAGTVDTALSGYNWLLKP